MIFVTVGTQKQQFTRLMTLIENSTYLKNQEVIVQSGYTQWDSERLHLVPFMEIEAFKQSIEKAEFVITHGGVGSIFSALKAKKKVLAIPRLHEFGEHVNDHQIEICEELEALGYLIYLKKGQDLEEAITMLLETNFTEYVSNDDFLDKLRKEI